MLFLISLALIIMLVLIRLAIHPPLDLIIIVPHAIVRPGRDGTLGKRIERLGLGTDDTLAITLILRVCIVAGRVLNARVGSIMLGT